MCAGLWESDVNHDCYLIDLHEARPFRVVWYGMEGWRPCFGTVIICHVQGVKRSQWVRVNTPTGSTRRPSTLCLHLIFSLITCDEPATTPRRGMGLGIEPLVNQSSQVALNCPQIFTAREIMTTQHPLIRGQTQPLEHSRLL